MGALMHESGIPDGPALVKSGIFLTVIAGVAVVLRVWGNNMRKFGFRCDDFFIAIGYVFWLVEQSLGLHALRVGIRAKSLVDADFITFRKLTYISSMFYFPAAAFVRIGIVCFYRRVFSTPVTPNFTRISNGVVVSLLLFGLSTTLAECMACIPAQADWDATVSGRCIKFTEFFVASASLESVFDAIVIALPLVEVYRLQMNWNQKIGVLLIFLLGSFSLVTGLVRVILTATAEVNGKINITKDILWMQIHMGTLFLCACLPTYRPLAKAMSARIATIWSSLTGGTRSSPSSFRSESKSKLSSNGSPAPAPWSEGDVNSGNIIFVDLNDGEGKKQATAWR